MEGKKILVFNFVLPMLSLAFLATANASGRDQFLRLPHEGQLLKGMLECCNQCQCEEKRCMCFDRAEKGNCTKGCKRCECDDATPPCYSEDYLESCPIPCAASPRSSTS